MSNQSVQELVTLMERIAALPLNAAQRGVILQAALIEFDGSAPSMPRVAMPQRYGRPRQRVLQVLTDTQEPLSARQIAERSELAVERVATALTKLYRTGQVERCDLEPSPDRGVAGVGRSTVYGYSLRQKEEQHDAE